MHDVIGRKYLYVILFRRGLLLQFNGLEKRPLDSKIINLGAIMFGALATEHGKAGES